MEKKRILVVGSEPEFTHVLKFGFETTGRYEVREENNGSRVVATAEAFKPDLILLDIVMPDTDGTHVAMELKVHPYLSHIPLVFITAIISRQEDGAQENRVGGQMFLAKPAGMKEIFRSVEERLGLSPALAEKDFFRERHVCDEAYPDH